jgi:hypothetical protein
MSKYQSSGTSNSPVIELKKERGNECFYMCEHVRLKVVKESGKATKLSLVNPENGERIFDLPSGANGLKDFEEKFGGKIIKKLPLKYFKDYDVAIPNIVICEKS